MLFRSRYYLPSDGLVGLASANAQSSRSLSGASIPGPAIPGLHLVGSFDVIHTPALESVFHATALTDTPAVSAAVVSAVTATPAGGPTCNPAAVGAAPHESAVSVPLHAYRAARHGTLPEPRTGDVVVTGATGTVRCGARMVAQLSPPVPGTAARRPRLWLPQGCSRSLRVSGRALLVRFRTGASLRIHSTDGTLRVRAHGARLRSVELRGERATRFHRVRLGSGGALPSVRAPGATLRVRAVRHGRTLRAQAFVPGG